MGTYIDNKLYYDHSDTGDSEENNFIIKKVTLDKYSVFLKLTTDFRFIDIIEIKINEPNFTSVEKSVDVNAEYQE